MRNTMLRKRVVSLTAAALMSVTSVAGVLGGSTVIAGMTNSMMTTFAAASVSISTSAGYGEGMYAQWSPVDNATGYNVYVDGKQIDSMLVRQYKGYFRADAVGLSAGSHTMKVVPVISGKEDTSKAAEAKAGAYAHDRSGFGFV
ncbi:MAG: hypothetical protein IKS03_07040, partial [Ruminococcus sp.]|nr:hypothetical protein [Ruminococcus sp.]